MGFLDRFLRKKTSTEPPLLTPPPASPPPPGAPEMLKAWDVYGRICEIPREEWRTKVLPENFRHTWNKPEELEPLINSALDDGFYADCLEPARQLHRLRPQSTNAINTLAYVLLTLGMLDESERLVLDTIQKLGKEKLLLNNLAKVQFARGHHAEVERLLWESLALDPNLENTFGWYVAIHRERGGDSEELGCLQRIAALPGSWRAQIGLGRMALKSRDLEKAIALYRETLERADKPPPADMLMQISGDLGKAGHLPEILQLVAPHFDAGAHGLRAGNNLFRAYLHLGQFDAARNVLDQLYRQNRGDWKEYLCHCETEIAKARVALQDTSNELPSVAMLTINGPVWLKPDSPAAELFPARPSDSPTVALIGSAAEIITNSKRSQHQLSDAPGRMSRALPLFLAEQLEFGSNARVQTLVPWITGDSPAFVFGSMPWEDADAAAYARQTENKSDYVVIVFLKPNAEPWAAELRLVRTIDAKCLGTLTGSFPLAQPEAGIPALANQLLALLREHAEVHTVPTPTQYQVPITPWFSGYLLRLEQLLAVRCSSMGGVASGFLAGEREIIDGNLQLCLEYPQNVSVRILFVQTLLAMKRVRPDVVAEYREKVARLQGERPLAEPAHSVVQRLLSEVFTA